jgi:hypothetical protein
VTAFVFALLAACSRGRNEGAELRDTAAPHLSTFQRFDEWARRAALGSDAFDGQEALREAAFSPLREEADVLGAWIVLSAPSARTIALEGVDVPSTLVWRRRLFASTPDVEVVRSPFSPRRGAPLADAIFFARSVQGENEKATIRVIVAFSALGSSRPANH